MILVDTLSTWRAQIHNWLRRLGAHALVAPADKSLLLQRFSVPPTAGETVRFCRAQCDFREYGQNSINQVNLRWSFQLRFRPEGGDRYRLKLDSWQLDTINGEPWAVRLIDHTGAEHVLQPNRRRLDVLEKLGLDLSTNEQATICGISQELQLRGERFLIAIVPIKENSLHEPILLGEAILRAPILFGYDGWLFLAGDRNDSPAQYAREFVPTLSWTREWRRYFRHYSGLSKIDGLLSYSFVVAPSKEELFPELYPLPRAKKRLIDVFLKRWGNLPGVVWPAKILDPHRYRSFDAGETHWNDVAGRLICESLLNLWGIEVPPLDDRFKQVEMRTDLGDKVMPSPKILREKADWKSAGRLIFDNHVVHHGNIRVWRNDSPLIDETVIVFGGSSADYFLPYLTAVFSRVLAVYSAASWDLELIERERPDRLILQTSQRFLTKAPLPVVKACEVAAHKVRNGQLRSQTRYEIIMNAWEDSSITYLKDLSYFSNIRG